VKDIFLEPNEVLILISFLSCAVRQTKACEGKLRRVLEPLYMQGDTQGQAREASKNSRVVQHKGGGCRMQETGQKVTQCKYCIVGIKHKIGVEELKSHTTHVLGGGY
jgi:hypothetical protein